MTDLPYRHDPYSSLRYKEFRYFICARLFLTIAFQIKAIVISWIVYEHTRDPWALGMLGLIEALPIMLTSLFGGYIADKFNRRKIILIFIMLLMLGAAFLTWFVWDGNSNLIKYGIAPVLGVVFMIGAARGFIGPAISAFAAQLIPKNDYANAAAWNSSVWQLGAVSGPALGGLLYVWIGAAGTSSIAFFLMAATGVFYFLIGSKPLALSSKLESFGESLATGIKFVFSNRIIISAITLDLFAVLFGGAVAMLPLFADQILHAGPAGLGYLRAAPALGAVIMAIYLAYYPPVKNSGKKMLASVFLFGVCMIIFALSTNFFLSLGILVMSGMFDCVSVVIRHTILQTFTPDEMRGRVLAVNAIFIGASNEIGAFESGLAAKLLGLIPSVLLGGAMTILVVLGTLKFVPALKYMELKKQE